MTQIQTPKNYVLKKLTEVCKNITSGGTPLRRNKEYFGGDIPWLKIGDLNNGIIYDSKEKITKKGLRNSSAKLFPKGTVLVAMYGATIGKTAILGRECATNQAICGLECNDDLDPNFLHYFLKSKYHELRAKAEGAAQPNINQKKIMNLKIPFPPLPIQKKIVQKLDNILSQFKEKEKEILIQKEKFNPQQIIQNYKNQISKLAFMGKLTNEIIIENMTEFSLPEGWELKKIEDITLKIMKGVFDLSPKFYQESGIPFLRISDIQDNQIKLNSTKYISEKKANEFPACTLKPNDIILAKVGSAGQVDKVAKIPSNIKKCNISQNLIGIKTDSNSIIPDFLFYFLQNSDVMHTVLQGSKTTSHKSIRLDVIRNLDIPIPPLRTQKKIVEILSSNSIDLYKSKILKIAGYHKTIKNNIYRLERSILNLAFTGKLVN